VAGVDVLVPTCGRPAALAVTLAGLLGQTHRDLRVVVADQTEGSDAADRPEVRAVAEVLRVGGRPVEVHKNLPRRGLAHQRQFLLDRATAPYALFLDDDVLLEPDVVERLLRAIRRERCGFVGAFVDAPSAVRSAAAVDRPPPDLAVPFWDGPVRPERVVPGGPGWERSRLHFAAHLHRLCERLGVDRSCERLYKVAWVGGCVLFDTAALRDAGGFGFWPDLPAAHCGEDVVAQLRVMARSGGAGLAPSGAWHQEVPTTTPGREVDAPFVLDRAD
jgi:GT2 family glycosyltransferase